MCYCWHIVSKDRRICKYDKSGTKALSSSSFPSSQHSFILNNLSTMYYLFFFDEFIKLIKWISMLEDLLRRDLCAHWPKRRAGRETVVKLVVNDVHRRPKLQLWDDHLAKCKSHGKILRVCTGIFTTALRNNKKNTVKFSIKTPHLTSTVHHLLSQADRPLWWKEPILASYRFLGSLRT